MKNNFDDIEFKDNEVDFKDNEVDIKDNNVEINNFNFGNIDIEENFGENYDTECECNYKWLLDELKCIKECCEECCEYSYFCEKFNEIYYKLAECLKKCEYSKSKCGCDIDWLLKELKCLYEYCEESCNYDPCCKKFKKIYYKLVKCLEKCKEKSHCTCTCPQGVVIKIELEFVNPNKH